MKKPLVINLYGGPGSGKSTMAARLFSELKEKGINCELITEYAKDVTWEESHNKLKDQVYIFAKQQHKLWTVKDKVDVIITDSPILLSLVYGHQTSPVSLFFLVKDVYDSYNNVNIFLNRVKKYNPIGRNQTEEEAKQIDQEIKNIVTQDHNIQFDLIVDGIKTSTEKIMNLIMKELL